MPLFLITSNLIVRKNSQEQTIIKILNLIQDKLKAF